jgi:hypothetical protein
VSRLNKALPLFCLNHVEGFGCNGFEEYNLSGIPICCQQLLIPAVLCCSLSELEQAEVELVPAQHTD